jgi:hypothetical protein
MEVIHDPHDPDPQRRYKGLLGAIGRKPAVSPNGIHWKTIGAKTIPSSDTSTLIYDELGKRYLAILKNGTKFGRSAAVAFSTDFKTWTTPRTTRPCRNETTRSDSMKSNWLSTAIPSFPVRAGSDLVIDSHSSRHRDSTRGLRATLTVCNSESSIGRS